MTGSGSSHQLKSHLPRELLTIQLQVVPFGYSLSHLLFVSSRIIFLTTVTFFKILFIHERHRERQRHRQREKQAPTRSPMRDPILGPESCPGPKVDTQLLSHPGIPKVFNIVLPKVPSIGLLTLKNLNNSVLFTLVWRNFNRQESDHHEKPALQLPQTMIRRINQDEDWGAPGWFSGWASLCLSWINKILKKKDEDWEKVSWHNPPWKPKVLCKNR